MTEQSMTGAQALVATLVDSEVDVCFANPGTSEMHFVAALDTNPGMRCVLGLFEGVVTGAADGYARMAGRPAATLLHLGPGLANGLANVHNAKKARSPMVNVVGEHATYHREFDAPLTSDIVGVATPMSHWVRMADDADHVASLGAEAVEASLVAPGQIATLILPADTAWNATTSGPAVAGAPAAPAAPDEGALTSAAEALRGDAQCTIFLGGSITEERARLVGRLATATGARVVASTWAPRQESGAGRSPVRRLAYFGEQAAEQLAGTEHLVAIGGTPPVTFFAYPDKPNWLTPEGARIHQVCDITDDIDAALAALVDATAAAGAGAPTMELDRPQLPTGELDVTKMGTAVAALMPEHTIVVNEAGTGGAYQAAMRGAPPHSLLSLTGGSIGYGLPASTGAAIACPDRRVLSMQADGAGMYTVQALWTQAREGLDITTVVFSNRRYAILQVEFDRVGAHRPGPKATSMLELTDPELDWVSLATGMGVPAARADTAEAFNDLLAASFAGSGPFLIEAAL
ncbi:MAG: acetolactate synthase large subunit [Actinomycetota bacterium]